MDVRQIITELKAQRDHVDHAIAALSGGHKRGRHKLSAAARKRISLAQKKRWAAKKR